MTTSEVPSSASTSPSISDVVSRDEIFALETHDLIHRFRLAIESLDPRAFEMDDALLDRVWPADEGVGSWTCRALVCHLFDTDLLFHARLRRTLVEEAPVFEFFDEHAYLASPLYGSPSADGSRDGVRLPIGAMVASVHTLRQTLAAGLYQLSEADWHRKAMSPSAGEMSFREILVYATWHFEHHAAFLNAKIERMIGPRPEPVAAACDNPEGAKPGGCGSGCGCASG